MQQRYMYASIRLCAGGKDKSSYRIQSRSEFFLRNFFVRYLRYRLDRGMLEDTVSFTSPGGKV